MPEKLERCVKSVMEQGKSEESAYAICNAQLKDSFVGHFRDSVVFNPTEKTALSVRDGELEYLGLELGLEPPDKLFKVYRSPATIANVAGPMRGLPVTDGHVSLDVPPPTSGGFVHESEMVDTVDPVTKTTIAIRNRISVSDTLLAAIESEKSELSLGYNAELVPSEREEFDFEQRNIRPHHLAAVPRGRCGPMCSFIDRLPYEQPETDPMSKTKLHKAFCDAEGQMNLQQIVELATALPEAIKSVPVDQLTELLPALQQIVEAAKSVIPEEETATSTEGDTTSIEGDTTSAEDEDAMTAEEEKKDEFSDAAIAKRVDQANRNHAKVIDKARDFLPADYKFADKSTADIMRDALKTVDNEQFSNSELPMAFKLLKKPAADYRKFGDKQPGSFAALQDKEL